jgi:GNAT superfamily N-acetyltransferase
VYCYVDDASRLTGVAPAPPGVDVCVVAAESLASADRAAIHDLFELTYEEANEEYLDRSLAKLRTVAMAHASGKVVGFSLGDQRVLDLPIVGATRALLAGLACVHPDHRRHGLFRHLSNLSVRAAGNPSAEVRSLGAGRMAHPASMRALAASPSVVPRPDRRPSALQRSIGIAVADAYGVSSFDPETFVCVGTGRPIGFPRMIQEVEPHEWKVFEPVDRRRGDALLALAWIGEAPAGW